MYSPRRRRLLGTLATTTGLGLSGCLRLIGGEDGGGTTTDGSTDGPTEASSRPGPDNTSFRFEHDSESLAIQYADGVPIPAEALVVQSAAGLRVRWHELGSTSVRAGDDVTPGATATIGPTTLNWETAVSEGETVRVVFVPEEESPTTLATFDDSDGGTDTETATETETEPETETETPVEGGVIRDGFEDGDTAGWTPVAELTSTFEAVQGRAASGSWSARFVEGSASDKPEWERSGEGVRPPSVETAHALANGEIYSDSFTEWRVGTTTVLRVNYNWSNGFLAVNGSGAEPGDIDDGAVVSDLPWPSSNRFFHVTLSDIDWDAGVVGEVRVNGSVQAEEVPFFEDADRIDRTAVFIGGNGGNDVFIDDTTVPSA